MYGKQKIITYERPDKLCRFSFMFVMKSSRPIRMQDFFEMFPKSSEKLINDKSSLLSFHY